MYRLLIVLLMAMTSFSAHADGICASTANRHAIIALNLSSEAGNSRANDILQALTVPTGNPFTFTVMDATTGETIFTCGIGDKAKHQKVNFREKLIYRPALAAKNRARQNGAARSSANMLDVADLVSMALRPGQENIAIIDAAMLYRDDGNPGIDFGRGLYPSDGIMGLNRTESVFSAAGKGRLLSNTKIYLVNDGAEEYANAAHKEGVTRFWVNFFKALGADVNALGSDAGAIARAAFAGTEMLRVDFEPADLSVKPMMIQARPAHLSIFDKQTTIGGAACLSNAMPGEFGHLKVVLIWENEGTDLDLHVSAGGSVLNHRNTVSQQGTFEKISLPDLPQGWRGFELVNMPHVRLADVKLAANIYAVRGSSGPVKAELRGTYGARCFSIPLEFEASSGNRGAGANRRSFDPHWVEVDLEGKLR